MATNGKVSSMDPLLELSPNVWFNIITMGANGKNANWRLSLDTLKSQLELHADSAYDLAVKVGGFTGTMEQWFDSLKGKSAYQIAVDAGEFGGTQEEWLTALNALYSINAGVAGYALVAGVDRAVWKALTKDMVGLDKVDNTPDMDKPVSTLVQQALDAKANNIDIPPLIVAELRKLGLYLDENNDLVMDEGNLRQGAVG